MRIIVPDYKMNNLWVKTYNANKVRHVTRACVKWENVRNRCKVGSKFQNLRPTYIGCELSSKFKDFQFFAEWCQSQVGYNLPHYNLDKDILVTGNKIYSEHTCVFVPRALNNFFVGNNKSRGPYPQGVTFHKDTRNFVAQINVENRVKSLGYFKTVEDASFAYKIAKESEARKWSKRLLQGEFLVDDRVIERMRTWTFEEILNG